MSYYASFPVQVAVVPPSEVAQVGEAAAAVGADEQVVGLLRDIFL